MKNPLRMQILIPVLLLLIGTIIGITLWGMYAAGESNRKRLQEDLVRVSAMIKGMRLTLNQSILNDMKKLSGGEFVVCNSKNQVSYSTLATIQSGSSFSFVSENPTGIPKKAYDDSQNSKGTDPNLENQFFTGHKKISGKDYLVSEVLLNQVPVPESHRVFVLFSQSDYQDLWWESARIPLIVGLVAIPLSFLIVILISSELTRPLKKLRHQIHQIASGDWSTVQTSGKGDEIDELATSVNQMATRLAELEKQIRENERLGILVQMGHGIAHNLRNSATGCRMAIEMHRMQLDDFIQSENVIDSSDSQVLTGQLIDRNDDQLEEYEQDNLSVAVGQLKLMEKYIQRFLTLDKASKSNENEPANSAHCDFSDVLAEVMDLVRPNAQHQNVHLDFKKPLPKKLSLSIAGDDLEQVFINLITNAIEATGAIQSSSGSQVALANRQSNQAISNKAGDNQPGTHPQKIVFVDWTQSETNLQLTVWDSGPGPAPSIKETIFDSFVTDKSGGIGLGLFISAQLTEAAGGKIWLDRIPLQGFDVGTAFHVSIPIFNK